MQQKVLLLYNEEAGHADHEGDDIAAEIEKAGYKCKRKSTKKDGWKDFPDDIDIVAVAGGDGTVGKAIMHLHDTKLAHLPVGVLPFGTANNIAHTVGSTGTLHELIASWGGNSTAFNTATVQCGKKEYRFCEGAGFGLFVEHLQDMKNKSGVRDLSPEERLLAAQKGFIESLANCRPANYVLEAEGYRCSGEYLMVEVINTKWIGPGLSLAPNADHSDGLLDVVWFEESDREMLYEYFRGVMEGKDVSLRPSRIRVPEISIRTTEKYFNVDGDIEEMNGSGFMKVKVDERAVRVYCRRECETPRE